MSIRPFLLIAALFALSGFTQPGLHNSTKVFTDPSEMRWSDWADPAEMERTWQAALVRIPTSRGSFVSTTIAKLERGALSPEGVWPTVIYMHGCTGFWSGTKSPDRIPGSQRIRRNCTGEPCSPQVPDLLSPSYPSGRPLPPDTQDAPE